MGAMYIFPMLRAFVVRAKRHGTAEYAVIAHIKQKN